MRCTSAALEALAGHKEGLTQLQRLLRLAELRYVSPVYLSMVYFGLGDLDSMCEFLEKGFQVQDPSLRPAFSSSIFRCPAFESMLSRLATSPWHSALNRRAPQPQSPLHLSQPPACSIFPSLRLSAGGNRTSTGLVGRGSRVRSPPVVRKNSVQRLRRNLTLSHSNRLTSDVSIFGFL